MQWNLKKMWATTATSLVAFTSLLNADVDNSQVRNLENRVSALEQRRGASGIINPPGRPQVKDGYDVFLYGDLLVWQAHENGLALGIVSHSNSTTNAIIDGKVKNLDFEWDVGFRLGVGYNLPHDGWDVNLTWLRFYTDGHKNTHADDDEVIYPKVSHPGDLIANNETCEKLHAHWDLHLNQLDLDLGREFFVSKWLTLRPHFGIRTDWIHQKFKVDYDDVAFSPHNESDVETENKDHWWAIGLNGGLDTQWGLGGGWSIYSNLGAAILYGFHKVSYEDEDEPATQFGIDADNSYHISHPVLDLQLGLRWDYMFSHDRFHLGLQGGWEHHVYFSQNQFMFFTDDFNNGTFVTNQGDLTFQGWTLAARFDF